MKFTQTFAFARNIVAALPEFDECLMWVTQWGVWPSCENWHLYYRLRQSYTEPTLLDETPGHLFLGFERADLLSFLQVVLLCGWDAHLLPVPNSIWAFISHDEFIALAADRSATLAAAVDLVAPFCKEGGRHSR